MSSILKALKRLEEERAERSDAPVDIARDILRHSRPQRRPAQRWFLIAAAATVAAAAAALLLLNPPALETASSSIPAAPAPEPPAPMPAQASSRAAQSASRPSEPEVVEVRMPQSRPIAKKAPVRTEPRPIERAVAPPAATALQPAASERKSVAAPPGLPQLTVSGIAFRAQRAERLAVVNDLPVMEGTVVEGARVEEILADRVRFSSAGRSFEVELGDAL